MLCFTSDIMQPSCHIFVFAWPTKSQYPYQSPALYSAALAKSVSLICSPSDPPEG